MPEPAASLRRWSPALSPTLRRRSPYTTLEIADTNSSSSAFEVRHGRSTPLADQMVVAHARERSPSPTSRYSFFPLQIEKVDPREASEQVVAARENCPPVGLQATKSSPSEARMETIFRTGDSRIEIIDSNIYSYDERQDTFVDVRHQNFGSTRDIPIAGRQDQSALHHICENASTVVELRQAKSMLMESPSNNGQVWNCASRTDKVGRTPLHLFSANPELAKGLETVHERHSQSSNDFRPVKHPPFPGEPFSEDGLIDFLIQDLLAAYPGAMMIQDINGHIPFQKVVVDWVESCNDRCTTKSDLNSLMRSGQYVNAKFNQVWESTSSTVISAVKLAGRHINKPSHNNLDDGSVDASPNVAINFDPYDCSQTAIGNDDDDEYNNHDFPFNVQLSANMRFALVMLSAIVDQLDRYMPPGSCKHSNDKRPRQIISDCNGDSFDRAMRELRTFRETYGSVDISTSVVQRVAAIPELMKMILLIDDDEDRALALSTSIVRRIMLSKLSIGSWLTDMLQSKDRKIQEKVVNYLKMVSETSSTGTARMHHSSLSSFEGQIESTNSDEFVNEVSRLQAFVPALLCLGDRGIEEASTTLVVRRVLDRMISRPFAVTVVLCDAIFLAVLIVGFRSAVNRFISGGSLTAVLQWIYVANTGIFYFIIREIGKMVSLCLIAKRARIYFLSFWNLIDMSATALALFATVSMRYYFTYRESGIVDTSMIRGLLAVTTGFLWLRVLSLLKAINMQLATFVLAILQITRDILWFCVILLTMVISFAQMFYTLLAPSTCALQDATDTECSQTEYLLKTYTILLGDFGEFGRDHFKSHFSVLLAVFYSFLVTVILLNVLIAIASDSYEKCLVRSQNLFGRARVMLIAELVSFQYLLRKANKADHAQEKPKVNVPIYSVMWWSSGPWNQNWSRGSVLFFTLSFAVIAGWIVGESVGYSQGEQYGNRLFSLASILLNVILYFSIMVFLARGAAGVPTNKESFDVESQDGDDPNASASEWTDGFIQKAMVRLLGTSSTESKMAGSFKTTDWNGRVDYLQREMVRLSMESEAVLNERIKAMETVVSLSESRIRTELHEMENRFSVLERDLMSEVRGTKETNALVTSVVDELKSLISQSSTTSAFRSPVPSVLNIHNSRLSKKS